MQRNSLKHIWHLNRMTYFVIDYVMLFACVVLSIKLSPKYIYEIIYGIWLAPELRLIGYGMPLLMTLGLHLTGLQKSIYGLTVLETIARCLAGITAGVFVFSGIYAFLEYQLIGRYILGFSILYGTFAIVITRLVIWKLVERDLRIVAMYGKPKDIRDIEFEIDRLRAPIKIVSLEQFKIEYIGESSHTNDNLNEIIEFLSKYNCQEIIVAASEKLSKAEKILLSQCSTKGFSVSDIRYFYEREFEKVHTDEINEIWFWNYDPAHMRPLFFGVKRLLDIILSLVGIILASPLALPVALFIKIQDNGNIIYTQTRVGQRNRVFKIYKFRTMCTNAEVDGPQWAMARDNRVTWIGRLLRKTRFDEVPQFLNILKGDMSFVGPRPERPEIIDKIETEIPFYRFRHLVKPGLSGWAQVNYPYGASLEDARQKLAYDLYYIKYASIIRELHIILKTTVAVVNGAR